MSAAPMAARPMTENDLAALRLVAKGMQTKQAARELKVSEQTIKDRLLRARIKLHAKTTAHAVALATSQGLI